MSFPSTQLVMLDEPRRKSDAAVARPAILPSARRTFSPGLDRCRMASEMVARALAREIR